MEEKDKKVNLVFRIKPDVEEHENKYARQLQADYESRLWKMEDFAKQFIALPSGVWNKIDAN
ncbi:unnamed protein product [Symbiodinium sp. CCMP2456]|nr:unnamed protein product [Symbiodinium sp. CCMP2456]